MNGIIPIKTISNKHYLYDRTSSSLYAISSAIYASIKNTQDCVSVIPEKSSPIALIDRIEQEGLSPDEFTTLVQILTNCMELRKKTAGIRDIEYIEKERINKSWANCKQIVVELTQRCNMKCLYCCYGELYNQFDIRNKDGNGVFENYKAVIEDKVKRGFSSKELIISFYGGEPLLNFETIKKIVSFTNRKFPKTEKTYTITTNGLLLEKFHSYLVKNKFKVSVSLDGNHKADVFRVGKNQKQTFPIVEKALNHLHLFHNDYFKDNVTFLSLLNSKSNYANTISFFSKYGKKPKFSSLSLENVNVEKLNVLNEIKPQKENIKEIFTSKEFREDILSDQLANYHRFIGTDVVYKIGASKNWRYPFSSCFLFQNRIFITVDGQILPCERVDRDYIFGKIVDNRVELDYDKINLFYKEQNIKFKTSCRDCVLRNACSLCFFANREQITKSQCKYNNMQLTDELTSLLSNLERYEAKDSVIQ